ncbi:MAG: UDP-N-acetylglucosamine 2-epimerase (non-hydrolyzing) [Acidobacteria bacterium]|nr:UDP-N-acetylglucosamine 2-epimerase (non-hydrolyzing) [Acidobacteriota bacterium]
MAPIRLTCVAGARPNFMKVAALLEAFRGRERFAPRLVHTGQHFSPDMSRVFFEELELPQPDAYLGIAGGSHAVQTAEVMKAIEIEFTERRPDLLVVVGDVNSTVAATLVASKLGIRVAHVEAGLRSFDRDMPEEINRLVTDVLSDHLFVSEPSGVQNLRAEGIPEERIFLVGNVMIDTLLRFRERAAESSILEQLSIAVGGYAVVTLHRPSNVDDPGRLGELIAMLKRVAEKLTVVFPVHPRTRQQAEQAGLTMDGLLCVPPLGYLDFLRLQSQARLVLTDSGGIQEETTILGVPCLTLRENTERPITIEQGTNKLVGTNPAAVLEAVTEVLAGSPPTQQTPALWDGHAAERIADILQRLTASPVPRSTNAQQRSSEPQA